MIDRDTAEEFTQGIGQIAGGTYKIIASAVKLGVPQALDMATEDWVKNYLGGYTKINAVERREVVRELAEEGNYSQREIASIVGVDEKTIRRDKEAAANAAQEPSDQDQLVNVAADAAAQPLDVEILSEEVDEPKTLAPASTGWHQVGPHWLFCGDSTDPEFVNRCSGAQFAFADPPYNAGKAEWDNDFIWDHDYLAEIASIVAVTPGIASLADFLGKTGMPYKWSMAVEITNGMTRGAIGFGNWVAVALFTNGSLYRNAKDVLRVPASTGDDKGGIHPSRKPIRIITELIGLFTNKDDLVIDPFLGSGTTLIAADKLGRRCIGAEIDPMYCAHIIRRYEEQT